jgi:hypothetical protein
VCPAGGGSQDPACDVLAAQPSGGIVLGRLASEPAAARGFRAPVHKRAQGADIKRKSKAESKSSMKK